MADKFTPGPWPLIEIEGKLCPAGEGVSILTVVSEDGTNFAAVYEDADARLISSAPDHALIIWALCVGSGRWEPFGDLTGEFCINGIRHFTKLDEFGCPSMTENMRAAILKSQGAL